MIQNLICAVIEFDPDGVLIFGYKIYFYALLITTGMICAIVIASKLMKKKGIPGDQSLDYAILVIPLAIIGCRIYFLLFPSAIYLTNSLRQVGLGKIFGQFVTAV